MNGGGLCGTIVMAAIDSALIEMKEKAFAFLISFGCPAGRALRGLVAALLRITRDSRT